MIIFVGHCWSLGGIAQVHEAFEALTGSWEDKGCLAQLHKLLAGVRVRFVGTLAVDKVPWAARSGGSYWELRMVTY